MDAADDEGVTALMHAAMHGYASLVDLLLLHGASPLLCRKDGESAHSLAALYGRPAALGAFFRHDAALVEARNRLGRTPLHNAVTLRHLITIKYLIGAWNADVTAEDAQGNTPLHLCRGPLEVLTLLYHGSARQPSLSALNAAGRTPVEEVMAASPGNVIIQALKDAADDKGSGGWLMGPGIDAKLLSFLSESPVRRAPKTAPGPAWWHLVTLPDVLSSLLPYILGLSMCANIIVGAALLFLGPVVASWWFMCISNAGCRRCVEAVVSPCPALGSLLVKGSAASASNNRPIDVRAPLGLLLAILFLMAAQASFAAPTLMLTHPILCTTSYVFQALLVYAYFRAVSARPSMLAGGTPEAAAAYWAALEALPPNSGFPQDFCERSELRKVARARYSPMTEGMVEVMDHDCIWIGSVVGQSNHPAFLAFLLAALPAMSLHLVSLFVLHPDPLWYLRNFTRETDDTFEARVLVLSFIVCVVLLFMVVPLLIFHIWGAAFNVTTMESMRFRWENPHVVPPWCCAPRRQWYAYSPYDKGIVDNLRQFVRGTRSLVPTTRAVEMGCADAADIETGLVATSAGSSPASSDVALSHAHSHEHRHHHHHGHSHSHAGSSGMSVHRVLLGATRDNFSED